MHVFKCFGQCLIISYITAVSSGLLVCYFVILSNSLFLIIFSTDIIDRNELRLFFETNCSQIYFIFYA